MAAQPLGLRSVAGHADHIPRPVAAVANGVHIRDPQPQRHVLHVRDRLLAPESILSQVAEVDARLLEVALHLQPIQS